MADAHKPLLGAAIAAALAVYAVAAARRRRHGASESAGIGRFVAAPQQITAAGWRDILTRVIANIGRDNVSLIAAGVAFYALLSLAPGFTALVALYGLVADPAAVQAHVAGLGGMMPPEAQQLVADELTAIVQAHSSSLGLGFVISLLIALWSANAGTSALISALNVAYGEREKRGLLRYYASTLLLMLGGAICGGCALLLIAVLPALLQWLPLGEAGRALFAILRWPALLLLFAAVLALLYRYAPCRREPRWSWVSWGAAAAALLWIAGSVLFSVYVGRFATYNKTYGSLGAVVVLLMWLWLSAYAVLLGAELNAEMERQSARDPTGRPATPSPRR
ncbi:MAG: YihY/virulence factor BrkB family protein [Stellaceae bacterium]